MAKTIGEVYGPAMKITDQDEADIYFEQLVTDAIINSPGISHQAAKDQELANLKFYAGHCDDETCQRVVQLFFHLKPSLTRTQKKINKAFESAAVLAESVSIDFIDTVMENGGSVTYICSEIAKDIRNLKTKV